MKNKTMGGLSVAVMLLLYSSQAEANQIHSWRAKTGKSPDAAKDNALVDMGEKLSNLSLNMLSKEDPSENKPSTEEMLQIHSTLYLTTFERVFSKVYHKNKSDDVDNIDIMAYSALGADAGAEEEPAFGAGGAIMEALAQSDPDIGLMKSAKNLAQGQKINNKQNNKEKAKAKDLSVTQVDEDLKKDIQPVSIGQKLAEKKAAKPLVQNLNVKSLLAERLKVDQEQSKEEKDLEAQIKKEQNEAQDLQKEIDSGKVSREQAMLASFTEGDEIEQKDKENQEKDYLSKSLVKKKSILQMAQGNFEQQSLGETASNMIGKAKKSVFKNLLNF